jgi:hypothetical protein
VCSFSEVVVVVLPSKSSDERVCSFSEEVVVLVVLPESKTSVCARFRGRWWWWTVVLGCTMHEIEPVSGGYHDRKVREDAEHENTPVVDGYRARRVWEGTEHETTPVFGGCHARMRDALRNRARIRRLS